MRTYVRENRIKFHKSIVAREKERKRERERER